MKTALRIFEIAVILAALKEIKDNRAANNELVKTLNGIADELTKSLEKSKKESQKDKAEILMQEIRDYMHKF